MRLLLYTQHGDEHGLTEVVRVRQRRAPTGARGPSGARPPAAPSGRPRRGRVRHWCLSGRLASNRLRYSPWEGHLDF